jgi:hypothetical protein
MRVCFLVLVVLSGPAFGQALEPRAYSPAPIGTNFLIAGFAHTTGNVSPDPSLPISNVRGDIETGLLAYSRTFPLFGREASAAILIPFVGADITGDVFEASTNVTRKGVGDVAFRVATNFYGSPALTPSEFFKQEVSPTLGASLAVIAPTGDYNSQHLINISSNRWTFHPEIGGSVPFGNWFADAAAGASFFTDNDDFFGGHRRSQDPIWAFQTHAGYNFRPGLWLAVDLTYYVGGQTSVDGNAAHDSLANSRFGVTLSVPLSTGFAVKFGYSDWLTVRNGSKFESFAIAFQYRWFDPE